MGRVAPPPSPQFVMADDYTFVAASAIREIRPTKWEGTLVIVGHDDREWYVTVPFYVVPLDDLPHFIVDYLEDRVWPNRETLTI